MFRNKSKSSGACFARCPFGRSVEVAAGVQITGFGRGFLTFALADRVTIRYHNR